MVDEPRGVAKCAAAAAAGVTILLGASRGCIWCQRQSRYHTAAETQSPVAAIDTPQVAACARLRRRLRLSPASGRGKAAHVDTDTVLAAMTAFAPAKLDPRTLCLEPRRSFAFATLCGGAQMLRALIMFTLPIMPCCFADTEEAFVNVNAAIVRTNLGNEGIHFCAGGIQRAWQVQLASNQVRCNGANHHAV